MSNEFRSPRLGNNVGIFSLLLQVRMRYTCVRLCIPPSVHTCTCLCTSRCPNPCGCVEMAVEICEHMWIRVFVCVKNVCELLCECIYMIISLSFGNSCGCHQSLLRPIVISKEIRCISIVNTWGIVQGMEDT